MFISLLLDVPSVTTIIHNFYVSKPFVDFKLDIYYYIYHQFHLQPRCDQSSHVEYIFVDLCLS